MDSRPLRECLLPDKAHRSFSGRTNDAPLYVKGGLRSNAAVDPERPVARGCFTAADSLERVRETEAQHAAYRAAPRDLLDHSERELIPEPNEG
jgi:hypothetical protein